LAKPILSLAAGARVVSFEDTPGLILRSFRSVKEWQELDPESKNDQDHVKKQEIHRLPGNDPHIWLDPLNAQKIIQNLVQILSEFDPENSQTYHSNGKKTILRLSDLNIQLETKMSSVSSKSYIVFHDAYQYFEKRYQLNPIASVTVSSGPSTSVGRLIDIRKKIKNKNVLCIFTEPQFSPKLVQTVISGTAVKKGILDPIGTSISPGPEMYFTLLNNIEIVPREKMISRNSNINNRNLENNPKCLLIIKKNEYKFNDYLYPPKIKCPAHLKKCPCLNYE